jgi:hypothetical protein
MRNAYRHFLLQNLNERDHSKDSGVDVKTILEWTGFSWLKIEFIVGLLLVA